jgi:hypothetical protein
MKNSILSILLAKLEFCNEIIGSATTETARQTVRSVSFQIENLYLSPSTTNTDIIAFWENERFNKPEVCKKFKL